MERTCWQQVRSDAETTIIIVDDTRPAVKPGELIPCVDVSAVLVRLQRRCPACGTVALVGHGRPWRTYQEGPTARRGRRRRVRIGRLRCTACDRTHTVLPLELGPRTRYRLEVLEAVCTAAGGAKARIAAAAGGVSPERIGAWLGLWQSRVADLIRFLELWLLSDPLGRRPVLVPGMSDVAYLRQLLGIAEGSAVFPEINRLLTAASGQRPELLLAPT